MQNQTATSLRLTCACGEATFSPSGADTPTRCAFCHTAFCTSSEIRPKSELTANLFRPNLIRLRCRCGVACSSRRSSAFSAVATPASPLLTIAADGSNPVSTIEHASCHASSRVAARALRRVRGKDRRDRSRNSHRPTRASDRLARRPAATWPSTEMVGRAASCGSRGC